jgi:cytochrome c556
MKTTFNTHLFSKQALSALFIVGTIFTGTVFSHGGATGVVKERMELMKEVGDNMKQVGAMVKGQAPFDSMTIAKNAKSISDAGPHITKLFPNDSLHKPSEALPAIWEEWDQFSALSDKLSNEANKLQEVAQGGDKRAITMQFAKLGKVCSGCHTDYRKKEEK